MAVKVTTKAEKAVESPPLEFDSLELEGEMKPLELQPDEVRKLPDFPSKTIRANKDELFWEWMDKLLPEDFNFLRFYLYREWPFVDRKRSNPDNPKYIDLYGNKFDKELIKKGDGEHPRHGSGKYSIFVNDDSKNTRKTRGQGQIGIVQIEINDPEFPPNFRIDELVPEHPSNRSLVDSLVAEGKLSPEGRIMQPNQQGGTDNVALIGLLTRMMEKLTSQPNSPKDTTSEGISKMYVDANKEMLGMVKDQLKSDDPDKTVKLIAAMKELMPKHESENSTLALIVKMQSDMAKVQADSQQAREALMLKMMEIMSTKPDASDAEDKILARIATYKELFGGGEGGRTKNPSIPELLIEHGAPVVLKVLETVQGFINIRNYQAGLDKQRQAQQQAPPQQPENPNPSIAPSPEQPKPEGNEMPKQEDQLIQVVKFAGASILGALQRGVPGDAFAESIEVQNGKLAYDQIAAAGKEKILEAMKAVPEFWNQVVPSSIEKFVDEFIAYGSEEDNEESQNA